MEKIIVEEKFFGIQLVSVKSACFLVSGINHCGSNECM
jgi:hypothetical protein